MEWFLYDRDLHYEKVNWVKLWCVVNFKKNLADVVFLLFALKMLI